MARVSIEPPKHINFTTEIDVLIQHINRGNHLANENLIALLNEARCRFFATFPAEQLGTNPHSFINADLAVIYKSEARHGDKLQFDLSIGDITKYGCDIVYQVSQKDSKQPVAIAKTAMLHFDYEQQGLAPLNKAFKDFLVNLANGIDIQA